MNTPETEVLVYSTHDGRCPFDEWSRARAVVVLLCAGDKARRDLDYRPVYSQAESIERTIDWFRNQ